MVAPVAIRASALGPSVKYRVLAALTALGAAECAAFALWPPDPDVPPRIAWTVGAVLALGSLVVWLVLPHQPRWFLEAWLVVLSAIIAGAGYAGSSASGQLACVMALCLLAAYCAYFLPPARMAFQVTWMLLLFALVSFASPHLDSLIYVATVVVGVLALVWMVAHLASELAAAAIRDPLTGTLNRRGLVEAAELVRAVLLRADRPITVAAIDLNDFKGYNDQHGHPAGDVLLASLAESWRGVLRSADVLARTGGDEFVMVLANTDMASAHSLLARLHEANPARWSAGLVEWGRGESFEVTLRNADKALYLAKMHPGRRG